MRRSFNGLSALVRDEMKSDPESGDLFVFANRKRTLLKVLCADDTGLIVVSKRPSNGTFALNSPRVAISAAELEGLLYADFPRDSRRTHRGQAAGR
jgi:transposase